jgi:uncharacterized protein (TIGR03086 family)
MVDRMTQMLDLDPPARRLAALVDGVKDDQLTAPTPCEHYTVGDLLDHLVGLTVAFRDAATKTTRPGPAGPGRPSLANLAPDWRDRLPRQLAELVAAWREPAAWEGMTTAGGLTMPGETAALVAVDELVLHGWDLAKGTGQAYEVDEASARAVLRFTELSSEPGAPRDGLFGPVLDVPADAPVFERALGLSGRRPDWTP